MTFQSVTHINTNATTVQVNDSTDSGFNLDLYKEYNYASYDDNQSTSTLANVAKQVNADNGSSSTSQKDLDSSLDGKPQSQHGGEEAATNSKKEVGRGQQEAGDNDFDDDSDDDDFDDDDFEIVSPVPQRAQPKVSPSLMMHQVQNNINFNPKIEAPLDSEIKSQIPLRKFGHGISQQPSPITTTGSVNSTNIHHGLSISSVHPDKESSDGFVTALSSPNVPNHSHNNHLHLGAANNNAVTHSIVTAFNKLASSSSSSSSSSQKQVAIQPALQLQQSQAQSHSPQIITGSQTPPTANVSVMSPLNNVAASFTPATSGASASTSATTPPSVTQSNFSMNNNIEDLANATISRKFSLLHKQSPPAERQVPRNKQLPYAPLNGNKGPVSTIDLKNVTPPQSHNGGSPLNNNGMFAGPQANSGIPMRRGTNNPLQLHREQDTVSVYSSGAQSNISSGSYGSSSQKSSSNKKNKKYNKTGFGSLFITSNDKSKMKSSTNRKKRSSVYPGSPTASIETGHTMASKYSTQSQMSTPPQQQQSPLLRGYNSPYESVDNADLNSKFNRSMNINDGSQRMMRGGPMGRLPGQQDDEMASIYSSSGKKKSWKKFF